MSDHCHKCRGDGRLIEDDPHSYTSREVWRLCDCRATGAPETRRSRDDDLAAYLAAQPWWMKMLTNHNDDEGTVRILDDSGQTVAVYGYDTRDRASEKAAVAESRAFMDGAAFIARTLGLNSAGVPVFDGSAQ